jgi:AcrR family transcriptional regulator
MTSRRERKKQETRARILEAARSLLREQGFEVTSLDEIAELADVSRATFFNYIPSKADLLAEIADLELAELARYVEGDLAGEPGPMPKIRRVMWLLISDDETLLQVTRRVLIESLVRPQEIPGPIARMESILVELVEEAQGTGSLRRDKPPEVIVRWIVGAYLAALAFHRWGEAVEPSDVVRPEAVERSVHMLFEGLAGPHYRTGQ